MSDLATLRARFERFSDDELVAILGRDRESYMPEAIQVAEAIARERGLTFYGAEAASTLFPDTAQVDDSLGDGETIMSALTGDGLLEKAYNFSTNTLVIIIWSTFVLVTLRVILPEGGALTPIGNLVASLLLLLPELIKWIGIPLLVAWILLKIIRSERARNETAAGKLPQRD